MKDDILKLIDAAATENAAEVKDQFAGILYQKIAENMDEMRKHLAKDLFKNSSGE